MKEAEAESCLTEFQRRGQSGLTRIGENSIKKQGFQLKHGETIRTWLMGREVGFVGIQKKKSRRGKERQESRSGSQEKRSSIFLTLCTCFSSGSLFLFFKIFIWLHWVLGVAHGILFLTRRQTPGPLHCELGVLVTGPPGKPWEFMFMMVVWSPEKSSHWWNVILFY